MTKRPILPRHGCSVLGFWVRELFLSSLLRALYALGALGANSFLFLSPALAQDQNTSGRPLITGIHHVRMYASNLESTTAFYTKVLGFPSGGGGCQSVPPPCFPVSVLPAQQLQLLKTPTPAPKNQVAEIAFATSSVAQMRSFLTAKGVPASKILSDAGGRQHFELRDPEGNAIAFVQPPLKAVDYETSASQLSTHILHAGFVVKDLVRMKKFYVDTLGFRLYWYGGFKDEDVDWYEIQVPDGNDWVEFMLNIPETADHKELGVQNHFSLGVKSAQEAAARLHANGAAAFDGPEIGRDGKNALDIYDPDFSRVEVMEFTPTKEPCCHPYTSEHPKP